MYKKPDIYLLSAFKIFLNYFSNFSLSFVGGFDTNRRQHQEVGFANIEHQSTPDRPPMSRNRMRLGHCSTATQLGVGSSGERNGAGEKGIMF